MGETLKTRKGVNWIKKTLDQNTSVKKYKDKKRLVRLGLVFCFLTIMYSFLKRHFSKSKYTLLYFQQNFFSKIKKISFHDQNFIWWIHAIKHFFFPMNVIEVGKPDVKVQLVGCETLCQYKSHLFPFWCRINHKSHAP